MSQALAAPARSPLVLGAEARPIPRLPRWTLWVFAAASVLSALHAVTDSALVGLGNGIAIAASLGAGCSLGGWAEERLYLLMQRRRPLARALALLVTPLLSVPLLAALGLALGGVLSLVHAEDWLPGALILAGGWVSGAALGSLVVMLIDTSVSALVQDFRHRLVLAILSLLLVVITVTGALAALAAWTVDGLRSGTLDGKLDININGSSGVAAAKEMMDALLAEPLVLAVLFFALCSALALPTLMSACAKLADAIMERIHPLSVAFDTVAQGDRDVQLEEAGSRDFIKVARSFNGMVESLKLAERMERAFGLYVSGHVLDRIRAQHGEALIPASLREATVFFADIRGFTSMSEKLSPPEVVGVLNRYFERVVEIVNQHDGYLNKFIGDAVVVVFNGPLDQPDHALRGARCAAALQQEVARLNAAGTFPEVGELRVGVGVATGPMVCGNIGGAQQLEYTVIGDTVNLSSRLTSKAGAGEVLVSEATARALPPDLPAQALEAISVKGKEKPVTPYRVWPRPVAVPAQDPEKTALPA